jgi:hypothetical protein
MVLGDAKYYALREQLIGFLEEQAAPRVAEGNTSAAFPIIAIAVAR